ncbi:MAG: hypothetical protein A4S09_16855 [Proteobacteria bacterium SG_bin7]|nr:MAG: hypothetical protein A4S09_16855 [Proteobacteria bacterium SG_bin7]
MKKFLFLSVVLLSGCSRKDLPAPEKKKVDIPVANIPEAQKKPLNLQEKNEPTKKPGDDPNRNQTAKVEAAPEIVSGEPKKTDAATQPDASAPTSIASGQSKPVAEKRAPVLHWDEIIKSFNLSGETQVKARTEAVKAMLGEKADEKIAAWRKDGLFQVPLAYKLTIEAGKEGKLNIFYSIFIAAQKQMTLQRSVVEIPYKKEISEAELADGVELELVSDKVVTAQVIENFGKAKIQRLKGLVADYLVIQERSDGKSMGLIFHTEKSFGKTGVVVQIFGREDKPELALKEANIVNFIDMGQEKLKDHIFPLKSALEKLPDMIAKNPELVKLNFDAFGKGMAEYALQTPDGQPQFLNQLVIKMKSSIDVLAALYEERKAAASDVPLEKVAAIESFDRFMNFAKFGRVKEEIGRSLDYLKRADKAAPELNLKELIDLLSSLKIDESDIDLACLLIWKEQPFVTSSDQPPQVEPL